jgi:EAL domain-containing protein (putative c-di-GMP-specific phosphodiesterase class I)
MDYLATRISEKEITRYLFLIFRDCEKLKYSPSIYKYNNKFVILLNNVKDTERFVEFLRNKLDGEKPNKELRNLTYQITCFKSPYMINSLDELSYFSSDETIYYITEKQFKEFEYEKALNKEIDDIFNLNHLSDPRIEVVFQPILNNEEKKFLSAEALSRLNLKDFGLIFPDKFIPILEEKKYIHKYSMMVLNKVCQLINQLIFKEIEFEGISVNFSLQEFLENSFEKDVLNIVRENGVDPSRVHIEITESVEVTNMRLVRKKIENLRKEGFKFYLDDFGTGYSNLSEIIEFPLDVIKFDKSLVWNSLTNENSELLINGMTNLLGKNFDILFEGIENEKHEELSKRLNIKFSQGYKYYKPLKYSEIVNVMGTKVD